MPEVRVIGPDNKQIGVLPTQEALAMADEQGLQLVEVDPRARPPVCRILDYGKFKYEASKKEKASKKHQATVVVKEVKFRPKTDQHDFDFKVNHIKRFLTEGNKCKLLVQFRGREIVHPETGQDMLREVVEELGDLAQIDQAPSMEGRRMVMVLAPRAGVIKPRPKPVVKDAASGEDAGKEPNSAAKGAAPHAQKSAAKSAEGREAPAAGDANASAPTSTDKAPQQPS